MFEGAPLLGACVSSVAELVADHLGPLGLLWFLMVASVGVVLIILAPYSGRSWYWTC